MRPRAKNSICGLGRLLVGERIHERAGSRDLRVDGVEGHGVVTAQPAVRLVGGRRRGLGLERPVAGSLCLVGQRLGGHLVAVDRTLPREDEGQRGDLVRRMTIEK